MPRKLSLLLLPFLTALALAETPAPVNVPDVTPDFAATAEHDWRTLPATFTLTATNSGTPARTGKLWVRKAAEGLLVAGHVDGPAPAFATATDTLVTSEHVEIWLAQQPDPSFPALGWGNQHGDITLRDESACAAAVRMPNDPDAPEVQACHEWVQRQQIYRTQLRRLFARQWMLAPGVGMEAYATPAHALISSNDIDHDLLADLKPQGTPALSVNPNAAGGYDFETLIPWQLFPPAASASLQDLYLMVEVVGPSGAYSSTAPSRVIADFSTYSRIRLEHPRRYAISPCHYSASGRDFFDHSLPGYFLPTADESIAKTFVLENDRRGYMDEAGGLSPNLSPTTFFWRALQSGGFVCGPLLRTEIAGQATDLTIKQGQQTAPVIIEQDSMDLLELPDGLLVRSGPRLSTSRFGAGACGLCPRAEFELYSIDKSLKITEQVHIYDIIDQSVGVDDADIQMAKDWSRVGYYRHEQGKDASTGAPREDFDWSGQFYCRKGLTYSKCGDGPAIPPDPRTLNLPK